MEDAIGHLEDEQADDDGRDRVKDGYAEPRAEHAAKLPMDDSASDRWCHASALSDTERMRLAAAMVYQYSPSFTTMDTTAAMSASTPGAASVSPRTIFITPA